MVCENPYGSELHTVSLLLAAVLPPFVLAMHRRQWKVSLRKAVALVMIIAPALVFLRTDIPRLIGGSITFDWATLGPVFILSSVITWGITYPRIYRESGS